MSIDDDYDDDDHNRYIWRISINEMASKECEYS